MKHTVFVAELATGETITDRILAADKIMMESTARQHGWELIEGPRLQAVLVHAALKRLGRTSGDLADFLEHELIDFTLELTDTETTSDPT